MDLRSREHEGRAGRAGPCAGSRRLPGVRVLGTAAGQAARSVSSRSAGRACIPTTWPRCWTRDGIAVRAGHHCANAAHAVLQPRGHKSGPASRFSPRPRTSICWWRPWPRFGPSSEVIRMKPRNPFASPRFGQIATFMLLPWGGVGRGARRRADRVSPSTAGPRPDGGTIRTPCRTRAVVADPSLASRAEGAALRAPARRRLRRRRRGPDLHRAHLRGRSSSGSPRSRRRGATPSLRGRRSLGVVADPLARSRGSHGPCRRGSTSTPTLTRGMNTSAPSSSTARRSGARWRRG